MKQPNEKAKSQLEKDQEERRRKEAGEDAPQTPAEKKEAFKPTPGTIEGNEKEQGGGRDANGPRNTEESERKQPDEVQVGDTDEDRKKTVTSGTAPDSIGAKALSEIGRMGDKRAQEEGPVAPRPNPNEEAGPDTSQAE